MNISRFSRDSPGISMICRWPWAFTECMLTSSVVEPLAPEELPYMPCVSAGTGANMKYIMTITEGTPNTRDHRKELRHLWKAKIT